MGVKGPKDLAKALGLDKIQAQLDRNLEIAADDIGDIAQDEGRNIIETSPTEGDWSEFYAGNPRQSGSVRERTGRVDTGQMLEDYTYQWTKTRSGVEIEVGWVGGDAGYYEDQEYGFTNRYDNGAVVDVPGMHAQERSQDAVRNAAERILRGLFDDR